MGRWNSKPIHRLSLGEEDQVFGRSKTRSEEKPAVDGKKTIAYPTGTIARAKFGGIYFCVVRGNSENTCFMRWGDAWAELLIDEILAWYADRCGKDFLDWLRKYTDLLEKPVPLTYEKYLSKIK